MLDERKTKENLRAEFPTDRNPYANDHDHEDNSDLEEDDEEDIPYDELAGALLVATEKPEDNSDAGLVGSVVGSKNTNFQSGNIIAGVTGRHHQPLDFGLWYRAVTYKPHACTPPSTLPRKSTDSPEALMLGKSGTTAWSRFLPQLPEGCRVKVLIGSVSAAGFSQVTEGFESFTQQRP